MMRKINLLLILLSFSLAGFSQVSLGVKGGVNFTNMIKESSMNPGFDLGAFVRFGNSFYFQPEVNYSLRSSSLKEALEDEIKHNFEMKTHNLDIPLLLGYKFFNRENFNFRLFIGPQISVMINNNYNNQIKHKSFHIMEYGGQVGVGIDFWRFTLDVKYNFFTQKYTPFIGDEIWLTQNMINMAIGFKLLK